MTAGRALAPRPGPARRAAGLLRAHFGGLPSTFWVVWSGVLVSRVGGMVVPFLTLYLTRERHMPVAEAGLAATAIGAGGVAAQFLGGTLADRWGRRATFVTSPVLAAAALVTLGYVEGLPATVAAAFAAGLGLQLYQPASSAIVADVVPPERRPRAYGLLYWAVNAGFSVAAVLGGVLARQGFLWLFWIDGLACLLFGLLIWWRLPPDRAGGAPGQAGRPGGYPRVFADRLMMAYVVLLLAHASVQFQMSATLPLAMAADGLGTTDYGLAIAANGLIVVLVQPFAVRYLADRDRSRVVAAGAFLIGAGYGLTAFAGSLPAYTLTVVVWTAGEIVAAAVVQTIAAELAPPDLRGRYLGVFGAAYAVAILVAPAWGTLVLAHFGGTALWALCFALCAGAAAGQLALGPRIRARRALAAAADGTGTGP